MVYCGSRGWLYKTTSFLVVSSFWNDEKRRKQQGNYLSGCFSLWYQHKPCNNGNHFGSNNQSYFSVYSPDCHDIARISLRNEVVCNSAHCRFNNLINDQWQAAETMNMFWIFGKLHYILHVQFSKAREQNFQFWKLLAVVIDTHTKFVDKVHTV